MLVRSKLVPLSNVVSALRARTQFGRILRQVERERRSFVVEKRGSPKAIILRVCDFFESSRELALKTKDLMASKRPENQKSHSL